MARRQPSILTEEPSAALRANMAKVPPPLKRPSSYSKAYSKADRSGDPAAARRGINTSTTAGAAMVSPDKPLTSQQLAFVRAWASGESIPNASIRAGYNDAAAWAYRLVKMPNILRVYEAEKKLYEAAGNMTRKRVMDGLLEAVEMAKLMAEPSTMVSGWREIGKMCGYYEPTKHKVEVNVTGDVTVRQLNGMSDADLLKLIKGNASADALIKAIEHAPDPDSDDLDPDNPDGELP